MRRDDELNAFRQLLVLELPSLVLMRHAILIIYLILFLVLPDGMDRR
jgi:hypothetical protein